MNAPQAATLPEAISFRIDADTDPKEQLKTLIRKHRIDEVECVIADIHGITRGKAMPATKFADMNPLFYRSAFSSKALPANTSSLTPTNTIPKLTSNSFLICLRYAICPGHARPA